MTQQPLPTLTLTRLQAKNEVLKMRLSLAIECLQMCRQEMTNPKALIEIQSVLRLITKED